MNMLLKNLFCVLILLLNYSVITLMLFNVYLSLCYTMILILSYKLFGNNLFNNYIFFDNNSFGLVMICKRLLITFVLSNLYMKSTKELKLFEFRLK